jgi:hypothetical protein
MFKKKKDIFKDGASDYSINMLWINKSKNEKQAFICENEELALKSKLLEPAKGWAKSNPEAKVNIWYDSKLYSSKAIKDTKDTLETFLKDNLSPEVLTLKISLKDINDMNIVKDNQNFFTEEIHVYFRIDLLKIIILWNSLANESEDAAIFADLNAGNRRAEKMDKKELFDENSMEQLKDWGILMGTNFGRGENKFIQVINDEYITETLRVYINASLNAATFLFKEIQFKDSDIKNQLYDTLIKLYNIPYIFTIKYIPLYYNLSKNLGGVKVINKHVIEDQEIQECLYNPEIHGYDLLGNFFKQEPYFLKIESGETNFFDHVEDVINFWDVIYNEFKAPWVRKETYSPKGNDHSDSDCVKPNNITKLPSTCKFLQKDPYDSSEIVKIPATEKEASFESSFGFADLDINDSSNQTTSIMGENPTGE